jgi:hypothetical protein
MRTSSNRKTNTRHNLRGPLLGLLVALGIVAAVAAPALAAPDLAPEITATPDDPNSAITATFEYKAADGETGDPVTNFQCRRFLSTVVPTPTSPSWSACGTDPDGSSVTYAGLDNDEWVFNVRGRSGTTNSTAGPWAEYTWTQDVTTVPSDPPTFTLTPDDPNTTSRTNRFEFTATPGDADLVDRFECRRETEAVTACNSGFYQTALSNGQYSLEVRAGNAAGFGPWTDAFDWSVAIPSPEPLVTLEDVAATRWDGRAAGMQLGHQNSYNRISGIAPAGDVNGDGRDDLIVESTLSTDLGLYVLFGSEQGKGVRTLADIPPTDGYRILPPATVTGIHGGLTQVGDQNGDGVPDLVFNVFRAPFGFGNGAVVVYGVADPSALPLCPNSSTTRCVDLTTITDDQGYVLISDPSVFSTSWRSLGSAGDFDDDGVADLIIGNVEGDDYSALIVKGGARSGEIEVADLPADHVLQINGLPGDQYFASEGAQPLGDINGDGIDDVYLSHYAAGGGWIFYGHDWESSPFELADFTSADGLRVFAPALSVGNLQNVGDVNGDGRPDLAFSAVSGVTFPEEDQMITFVYGPEQPAADPIVTGMDLSPGAGYLVTRGGLPAGLGEVTLESGDLNNDGVSDLITSAPETHVDGSETGAAYLLFGQDPTPSQVLGVGPQLTADLGVALVGEANGDHAGSTLAPLGDLDDDGLTDFAIGAPLTDYTGSNAGSVYIVYGKTLLAKANTGNAVAVTGESAVLNAPVASNNRDTEVHFEYGTTEEYGETSSAEQFEGSSGGDAASIQVTGLQPNATYHYRAVATNELGLTRYGDDRTFTTGAAVPGDPCVANPAAPGCPAYQHCQANPSAPECVRRARLSALVVSPRATRVRRGRRAAFTAIVTNAGNRPATNARVCVKAPRHLKGRRCKRIGALGAARTATRRFAFRATRAGRFRPTFTARAAGVAPRSARAILRVTRPRKR